MSFATPLFLLGLLVLPLMGAWYGSRQRTRRLAAAAFAAPAMAPSVTPRLPGWRRHAPLVAFALALIALVIAAARPRVSTSVVVAHLQTMLALDMSGSMQARDIAPSRAAAAQRAADVFVGSVPTGVAVGVMQFNQTPQVLALPSRDHQQALRALGRLRIGGATAIGSAVNTALAILKPAADPAGQAPSKRDPSAAIVLLSDGKSTSGADPLAAARAAHTAHIPIFTISLGTASGTITVAHHGAADPPTTVPVPVESSELEQIARASGGQTYAAADANRLSAIYKRLSARLSHRDGHRELLPYVLAAGLGLLLLGSALSLNWFGRLV